MRGNSIHVHPAHMPGACGLALSHDGCFALTSGSDATLRSHDIRDASPDKHKQVWWRGESPTEEDLSEMSVADFHEKSVESIAVAPSNTTMATGSEDGFVRIFSIGSSKSPRKDALDKLTVDAHFIQACARFAGPVRTVCFSPTGSFLAAAGDEPGVLKIIMTAQPTNVNVIKAPKVRNGVEAIKSLAYDPNGDYVVSVGEFGQAVVWDVEKCILASIIEINDRKASSVAWAPDGSKMVFGTDKGAIIVSRNTWVYEYQLQDATDEDDDDDEYFGATSGKEKISAVAWSANGKYILIGREDSNIRLWDVHDKKMLGTWKGEEVAQTLRWHPQSNAFVVIDRIGQWGLVPNAVPEHMPPPQSSFSPVELPTIPEENDGKKSKKNTKNDDDDEECTVKRSKSAKARRKQQEKKKADKAKAQNKKKRPEEDEEIEPDNLEDQGLENGFTFDPSDVDADDEDDIGRRNDDSEDDDDESETDEEDEEIAGELADLENDGVKLPPSRKNRRRSKDGRRARTPTIFVQESFMPSSTPLTEKVNKKRHILAWNLVGAVLSYDETSHDVIEIEFAESSRRTIGIKDHFGYSMGSLSETGVFLASKKKKEHDALFSFRPFSSWANNSEWVQFLSPDEDISCIALGQRFVAVGTTPNSLVRLFSLSGIQTGFFGVPGPIITMAARDDHFVVVYAEPGTATLRCDLLDVGSTGEVEKVRYSGVLMQCPNTKLEWIGFTNDTNELCCYDSNGWLWVMPDPRGSKRWIPLMQGAAKLGGCDWFWVAAATSNTLIGAPCLSNERYPPAKPRPALRSLPLSAPVIERVTKTGKPTLIERFSRTKLNLVRALNVKADAEEIYESDDEEVVQAEDKVLRLEVEADKCILAMMEEACKREQNTRALDLASRLHHKVSFKYAIELAKHYKRNTLATRVERVAYTKMEMMGSSAAQPQPRLQQSASEKNDSSPVTPEPQMKRTKYRETQQSQIEEGSDAEPAPNGSQTTTDGEAEPNAEAKTSTLETTKVKTEAEEEPEIDEEIDEDEVETKQPSKRLPPRSERSVFGQGSKRKAATTSSVTDRATVSEITPNPAKKLKTGKEGAMKKSVVKKKGGFHNRFLKK